MIISDAHRFGFVHIPKCAGTSVRKALRPIDETVGMFDHISDHPQMGPTAFGHITLSDLARYFPEYYSKLVAYRTFAIVRDPIDRFVSAMFQRLREYEGMNQSEITPGVLMKESKRLVTQLQSATGRLDLAHVHFNRQSDYVFNNGVRIVDRVFALDRLAEAAQYVHECAGLRLDFTERENQTVGMRYAPLRAVARLLRAPYGAIVPNHVRSRIRTRMTRAGIYGALGNADLIKPGSDVDLFIRGYYSQDFDLHAEALAA